MSELLKALQSMPPVVEKQHTVCIEGREVVVSLDKKKEIMRKGEQSYHWVSPTRFELRPPPKPKTRFSVLVKAEKGYSFEHGDIHWPNGIMQGGEAWQIESE
jgi:hypothetical protein